MSTSYVEDDALNLNTDAKAPSETEVLSPADAISPLGVSPQVLLIGSLSIAVILIALWLFARRKSHAKGTALLLLGPSDAGKTAILSTLVYNQTLPTHTSMQTNSSIVTLPDAHKSVRVLDIPGHPRVRNQFREHMSDAEAIAFVVDASTVSRNGAAVAEHLHTVLNILTSLPPSQPTPPLVVLAHKADLLKTVASAGASNNNTQLAINRVRTILERELDKRRASHAGGVTIESLGDDGKEGEVGLAGEGGLECSGGGEFRFADWEGGEVAFIGTWVKVGGKSTDEKVDADGLAELREWLLEVA